MFKIVHLKNIYGRRLCDSLHPTHRLLTHGIDPMIDKYENTISSHRPYMEGTVMSSGVFSCSKMPLESLRRHTIKRLETRVCVVKWHSRDAKRARISKRSQTLLIHKVAGTESQHFCRRNNELCTMQGTWVASWPVQFIKDTRPDPQRTDRFFLRHFRKGKGFCPIDMVANTSTNSIHDPSLATWLKLAIVMYRCV